MQISKKRSRIHKIKKFKFKSHWFVGLLMYLCKLIAKLIPILIIAVSAVFYWLTMNTQYILSTVQKVVVSLMEFGWKLNH